MESHLQCMWMCVCCCVLPWNTWEMSLELHVGPQTAIKWPLVANRLNSLWVNLHPDQQEWTFFFMKPVAVTHHFQLLGLFHTGLNLTRRVKLKCQFFFIMNICFHNPSYLGRTTRSHMYVDQGYGYMMGKGKVLVLAPFSKTATS